jgi:hypothetical protein
LEAKLRKLTDHITSGDQAVQLEIVVMDKPGAGGANHLYDIRWNVNNGVTIPFQNGPIKENGVNGITGEALMAIQIDRLRGFQEGPYRCRENAIALTHMEEALMWLQKRTRDRIARGVEGTTAK